MDSDMASASVDVGELFRICFPGEAYTEDQRSRLASELRHIADAVHLGDPDVEMHRRRRRICVETALPLQTDDARDVQSQRQIRRIRLSRVDRPVSTKRRRRPPQCSHRPRSSGAATRVSICDCIIELLL